MRFLPLIVYVLILAVREILYRHRERTHKTEIRRARYYAFNIGYEAGYDDRAKEDDGRADIIRTANPWADDA